MCVGRPGRPLLRLGDEREARRPRRALKARATPAQLVQRRPEDGPDSLRGTMVAHLEAMAALQLSAATLSNRAREMAVFASWCEERAVQRAAEVTRPLLERYQRHLFLYRKANGAPLSVARQLVVLASLRAYFRWLSRQGLLLANPAADLQMPKKPTRLPRYAMSVAEVEKVLAVPDTGTLLGLRDRALLEVLWATGIRRGELARLCLWDVQWERGALFIQEGKGKKDRVVPISHRALGWVRRYIDEVRPRYAMPSDGGRLFLSEEGAGLSPEHLTIHVSHLVRASGVEAKGSCHLFRHACATAMLEGGADVRFIQELLGHANTSTTQVYTRVSVARLKAVYEATHPGAKAELLAELEAEAQEESEGR
jgi:integrase/recombinase XerD